MITTVSFSSVQFSHSVMSDSLWPHELQHTRPPCPSPTPGVYANSCPLSRWCHLTISSAVIPFSSSLQPFPNIFRRLFIRNNKNQIKINQFSSVAPLCPTLQPYELQHVRPPCPSPTSGVHSHSRPLSWWCHPAISSSAVPFSSFPQALQHQSLFQWVNSWHEVAKVLEFQL